MLELSFPFPSYPFIHVILSPEFVLVVFLLSCPEWSRLLLFCPEGFCLLLSCPEGSCIFTILSWPVLYFYYPVLTGLVFLLSCPERSCLFAILSWVVLSFYYPVLSSPIHILTYVLSVLAFYYPVLSRHIYSSFLSKSFLFSPVLYLLLYPLLSCRWMFWYFLSYPFQFYMSAVPTHYD